MRLLVTVIVAGAVGYGAAGGLRGQVEIVKPVTVLATTEDTTAFEWIEANVAREAVFLVNGWRWLNNTWASPDGGAWLMALTGRRATLPPVDYTYGLALRDSVNDFYGQALPMVEAGPGTDEALAELRRAGVTHVYIGAKGGTLKPEMFAASPAYRLLYANGGAWVFEIEE